MGRRKIRGFGLIWLAVLGMVLPVPVLQAADGPAAAVPTASATPPSPAVTVAAVSDVALSADGLLRGQLLSPQGRGLAGVQIAAFSGNRSLGSATTDADGRFAIAGLKGGVVTLVAGQTQTVVRVWTPKGAPAAAKSSVLLVDGQPQALGQSWRGFKKVITNPWVIAGVVAAAVAIPVAIHNANDDDPASP
ncbi:MAG: hypothetical protein GXX96_30600 [Planctomycetaceae bacterium]|nr:hypothetical protein [Planctomycetaceae bacterium]